MTRQFPVERRLEAGHGRWWRRQELLRGGGLRIPSGARASLASIAASSILSLLLYATRFARSKARTASK
jgi:hypothetical protein